MSVASVTNPPAPLVEGAALHVPDRYRLGDHFVPKARYLDKEFLERELDRIFPYSWLMACREEELHDVGDFVEFTVGDQSILLVREHTGIRAFFNSCRHRGTRLAHGRGKVGMIRCPFHGWRWNLDGSIRMVLDREDFVPCSDEDLALVPVSVDSWAGFVFVNMDPDPQPLLDYLAPLPEVLAPFKIERMRVKWYKSITMPCNWKTGMDAFIEAYHVAGTHPQLIRHEKDTLEPLSPEEFDGRGFAPTTSYGLHSRFASEQRRIGGVDTFTRYDRNDVLGDYDQRARIATRVAYTSRELRVLDTPRDANAAEQLLTATIPPDTTVSAYYAQLRRELAEAEGIEWPVVTDTQRKAAGADWHVFPNLVVLPNEGSVLCHRTRPNGLDPDSCIFDAIALYQIPVAEYDDKHEFTIEVYSDYQSADVGGVLEQDFHNLGEITAGMHSRAFKGLRLNKVQETTVLNHHQVADRYLWA